MRSAVAGPLLLVVLTLQVHGTQAAEHAHQHGAAALDVAVDAQTLVLQLSSPLDNLLGFERAPGSDAERRQADALVAQLRAATQLFTIDPAAGCVLASVELTSAALRLGQPEPSEAGHADIDASFSFRCRDATRAAFIDVALFRQFSRLQKLAVQVATPGGQARRDLQRPASRIVLGKP